MTESAVLRDAWAKLEALKPEWKQRHLRELFSGDPQRFARYHLTLDGLLFDYSRHWVDGATLDALLGLARAAEVENWRERLFAGERVNDTEQRAALHSALRESGDKPVKIDGSDVMPLVKEARERMRGLAQAVQAGERCGATGKSFTDVVNIGIGGSHLGPEMAIHALADRHASRLRTHFVANVDPHAAAAVLRDLDPATTLFVVASKTFTTQETLTNARAARRWLAEALGEKAVGKHFLAVSSNADAVRDFGIGDANMLPMWDWVGGRYSVWSAIGLPIMLAYGPDVFDAFLAGAERVDRHFCEAPLGANIPVLMALLGAWYGNVFDAETHAVLPYRESLKPFVDYLQQLDMESLGKCVGRDGRSVTRGTGRILWGDVGTNGQHAFFQLLHQGTHLVPADFILALDDNTGHESQQTLLLANALAQTAALTRGRGPLETDVPYRQFPGNRPTTTLVLDCLDARHLGMLVALYEHKVFVQSCLWQINPFDQWGVELGKQLAGELRDALDGGELSEHCDASTRGLIAYIRRRKNA